MTKAFSPIINYLEQGISPRLFQYYSRWAIQSFVCTQLLGMLVEEKTPKVRAKQHLIVQKLLSEDPDNYPDAPTEGIRRILAE